MTVIETLNEGLKRGYDVEIPASDIAARVETAIAELAPQMRLPGFRPGKVPGNLIRRMHGKAIHQDELQKAINAAVNDLMQEKGLRPANQPDVNLDAGGEIGEDVKFSLAFEVLPDVPETQIEGIELERLTVEAGDADVDAALERMAKQARTFEDAAKTHKAKNGDLVVMNYVGTVDGEPFDGGTGEDMQVELGSGRLIPGFEEALVGVKAGEEREVKLTFPEDYPAENLKGKDAVFQVKATAVKVAKIPEIADSLAESFGLESLDKLKEVLKDQVAQELNNLTRTHLKRKLLDHLAASVDFDVPPSMVEAEFKQILQQAGSEGELSDEDRGELGRIAERRVRLGLLLSDVGQKHSVQITQEEMNRLVAREASRYPGQQEQVFRFFNENPMAAAQLRAPLFEDKVVDLILGKAAITDRTVTREELEAAIEDEDETPFAAHDHGHHHHHHDHGHDHDHDHGAGERKAAKKPAAKKAVGKKNDAGAAEKAAKPKKSTAKAKTATTDKAGADKDSAGNDSAGKDADTKKAAAKKPVKKAAPAKDTDAKAATKKPAAKKAPAKKAAAKKAD